MRQSRPRAKQRGITALGRRVARSSAQRQSVLIRIGSIHRAGNLSWAAAGPVQVTAVGVLQPVASTRSTHLGVVARRHRRGSNPPLYSEVGGLCWLWLSAPRSPLRVAHSRTGPATCDGRHEAFVTGNAWWLLARN